MSFTLDALTQTNNELAKYYTNFKVSTRLLMTGHSHQAWPDIALEGVMKAYSDAAEFVDGKWQLAMEKAEAVKQGYSALFDDRKGDIALAANTHELLVKFLSALPLRRKPKLLTTDGEFHTIRRQLDRLSEENVEIVKVSSQPASEIVPKLIERLDESFAAVLVSKVLFQTGEIVQELDELARRCEQLGVPLLIDAYHSLNSTEFTLENEGLEGAYVLGGGYKYMQLGEGNCFLRLPENCMMRPVVTGWFAEFSAISESKDASEVVYGQGGDRFAGSTYDPTSHYRAAEVFKFFKKHELTPRFLRQVSRHQLSLLANEFDRRNFDDRLITRNRDLSIDDIAGFMVFKSEKAAIINQLLLKKGVLTDYRGSSLRFGPAPYVSDEQIIQSIDILEKTIRDLSR